MKRLIYHFQLNYIVQKSKLKALLSDFHDNIETMKLKFTNQFKKKVVMKILVLKPQ